MLPIDGLDAKATSQVASGVATTEDYLKPVWADERERQTPVIGKKHENMDVFMSGQGDLRPTEVIDGHAEHVLAETPDMTGERLCVTGSP